MYASRKKNDTVVKNNDKFYEKKLRKLKFGVLKKKYVP